MCVCLCARESARARARAGVCVWVQTYLVREIRMYGEEIQLFCGDKGSFLETYGCFAERWGSVWVQVLVLGACVCVCVCVWLCVLCVCMCVFEVKCAIAGAGMCDVSGQCVAACYSVLR